MVVTGLDRRARILLSAGPSWKGIVPMADVTIELLKTHFRQLRLPTMGREFERLRATPPRPTRPSSSSCSA